MLIGSPVALTNPYTDSDTPEFQYDDSRDVPWLEEEVEIPGLPQTAALQRLPIDGLPPGLELHLDTGGLTVNPDDQVIRLWVYLRSDQGVENGTYEGFRCISGEYKVYAYATPQRNSPVTRAKRPVWRKTRQQRANNYRRTLMNDYLCGLRGARPVADIQHAVRTREPRDPMLYR